MNIHNFELSYVCESWIIKIIRRSFQPGSGQQSPQCGCIKTRQWFESKRIACLLMRLFWLFFICTILKMAGSFKLNRLICELYHKSFIITDFYGSQGLWGHKRSSKKAPWRTAVRSNCVPLSCDSEKCGSAIRIDVTIIIDLGTRNSISEKL